MRPRRLISRVLLGAALGAATTIGIVLWLALRGVDAARRTGIAATTPIALPDPPIAHLFFPHLDGLGWTVLETHSWKLRTDAGEFVQADDPTPGRWNISTRTLRKIDARPDRRRPLHSGWLVQSEFQFGWPFRAAWAIEGLAKDNFLTTAVDEHLLLLRPESRINGPFLNLRAPAGAPRPRSPLALPTGILPLGFAADTTIFGATWLLLFATLSQLRARYRRRRKHLCPHCSYPREGLPANAPCPECGTGSQTP